ncbi:MAG: response regulator [Armatimonadetes bacterium]|nr:response regulator [Armatimonadota bacterium]
MRKVDVLLVEDNPDHIFLTRKALSESEEIAFTVHVVRDGEEAIHFVRRVPPYERAPRPDIVLLDIQLPRKDGFRVLEELKSDPGTRIIPVLMLTTSDADADILKSYGLGTNSYIAKPIRYDEFSEKIRSISNYWGKVSLIPPRQPGGV